MYLRGSKWNMSKRSRRRSSPFRIFVLVVLIAGGIYLDRFVVPTTPSLFSPTPTPTRSPESFLNEAESLYKAGKLLPAIDAYQQAIQVDPKNRAIYVALSRAQIFAGQYEQALENAERALVGNESYALAHALKGWALNYLEKYSEAMAAEQRALELEPNNALAHAFLAEILANKNEYGDLEKAAAESKTALDLAPNTLETLRARGYVLYVTGNYTESIDMYQKAIAINKNIPDLFLYLGYNYQALADTDPDYVQQAIDAFLQANILNPSDPIPDVLISRMYLKVGEYQKAIQYAENAVNEDPTNAVRYGLLGYMYYRNENYDKAIPNLALAIEGGTTADGKAIQGQPIDYGWMSVYAQSYGLALAKTNRCGEANTVFEKLLKAVPEDTYAIQNAEEGMQICGVEPAPTATATPEKKQ